MTYGVGEVLEAGSAPGLDGPANGASGASIVNCTIAVMTITANNRTRTMNVGRRTARRG